MSHINYSRLYCFWRVYREGSVVDAAGVLYLAPQTITGQARALEECLQGKLFKHKGRGLKPSELREPVRRYAGETFTLSQEMLDIVNYRKEFNLLFDVGVADTLSKRLVSSILDTAVMEDEQIHLRCFESTHEMFLEQLSQHKLDMIISDCSTDSAQQEGLFSMKTDKYGIGFQCANPLPEKPFPTCLEERRLLVPRCHSVLGYRLLSWFSSRGSDVEILGESDNVALMKAFGATHNAIFVVLSLCANDFYNDDSVMGVDHVGNVMEEYHAIFAERMIQHPAIQHICSTDYSTLFTPASK